MAAKVAERAVVWAAARAVVRAVVWAAARAVARVAARAVVRAVVTVVETVAVKGVAVRVVVVRVVVTGKFRARKQPRCTRPPSLTHPQRANACARALLAKSRSRRDTRLEHAGAGSPQSLTMATVHSLRTRDIKSPGRLEINGSARAPTPSKLTPSRPRPIKPILSKPIPSKATPSKATASKPNPGEGASNTVHRLEDAQRKLDRGQKAHGTTTVGLISSSWTSAQSYFRLYWFPVFVLASMAGLLCWCGLHFWEVFSGGDIGKGGGAGRMGWRSPQQRR